MTVTQCTSPLTAATSATKNTARPIVYKIICMCTTKEKGRAEGELSRSKGSVALLPAA